MNIQPFAEWELRPELVEGLAQLGITQPTPVQQQAYAPVLAGRDLLVQSRTGTGKTFAFGLPMLQRLASGRGPVEALIVLPTRELALQVGSALGRLARPLGIDVAVLYGGGSYRDQLRSLEGGAKVVVGTPGRLCDHLDRGSLKLGSCKTLVLDEADEMLDMGFADELERIMKALGAERQSLLFSATMAPEMATLAKKTLRDPVTLAVSSGLTAAPEITHVSYETFREHKVDALVNILHVERPELAIVFCHTKAETEQLADRLRTEGLQAAHLNGDMAQAERTRTLNAFRRRQLTVLVATDVAARGIDVKGVSHVFNMGVTNNGETYIHRTGRTGRAGASGTAVTFVAPSDAARFRRLLNQAGIKLEVRRVPQADDVRKRLREIFHEGITKRVAGVAEEKYAALATELLAYIEPMDLVAALLQSDETARAALEAGLDVQVPAPRTQRVERAERVVPAASREMSNGKPERAPRKLSEHSEAGMQRIHLNLGKVQQFAPGRLVQLVCSATGLKGDAIGAIAMHAHFCFFDVKEAHAEKVATQLSTLSFNGKRMKANLVPSTAG